MTWGAVAMGVGTAAGGIAGGMFGSDGARKQITAMREAIALDKERYEDTKRNLSPFVRFGKGQLDGLDNFMRVKNPDDYIDPGYEFRSSEGLKGLYGNNAAAGMLQSGDTIRGALRYGQGLASEEYGNAFNRWLSEGNFRQNLAGMGQSAAAGLGYMGAQSSANIANATSNTDFGAPSRIWGDVAGGVGGLSGNMLAKYLKSNSATKPSIPGGSNVIADDIYSA